MPHPKPKPESPHTLIGADHQDGMNASLRSPVDGQRLLIQCLDLLNRRILKSDVIERMEKLFRTLTGMEAVGIRMKEGADFPYCFAKGFPDAFIKAENSLCARDIRGEMVLDAKGNPILEFMCGTVIQGTAGGPPAPYTTPEGSF